KKLALRNEARSKSPSSRLAPSIEAPVKLASWAFTCSRPAPSRLAPSKRVRVRLAPVKLAPWPFTPPRLASVKLTFSKSEPNSEAPLRSARARSALEKLVPKNQAPCKSEPTSVAPVKLAPMKRACGSLRPDSSQETHMPPNENTRETSSPWSAATAWLAAIIPPKLAMQSEAAMRQRKAAGDRSNGGRSQTRRATKAPLLFVTPRTPRRYLNPGNGETLITGTQTKSTRKAGRRVAAGRVELALREADRPPHLRAREVDAVEIGAAEVRAFEVGADEAGV